MHVAANRRRVPFRNLRVERLEDRLAPAVLSFRAGAIYTGAVDTEISAFTPNANASTNASMSVVSKGAAPQVQALLRFDSLFGAGPDQIPLGSKIQSASLSIWVGSGATGKAPIELHRVNVPWTPSTATWNFFNAGGGGIQTDGVEARSSADGVVGEFNSTGYRVIGGLSEAIQSWQGGSNFGWVISAAGTSSGWSMNSADGSTVEHRPILTVNFAPQSGTPKPTYVDLSGSPPPPTSQAWFNWESALETARLARVPSERGSTYYFAANGNDATGTGDVALPWRSLAKAQAVLAASSGDVRLRFRRGDVWLDTAVLRIDRPSITVDSYGNSALAAPLFSRFTRQYTSGWTQIPSSQSWVRSEPTPVGWLRRAGDPLETLYYRAASAAEVNGRADSWYYDRAGGVLFFNPGTTNPNSIAGGLDVAPDDANGWTVSADGVRLQDLQIQGSGLSTSGTGAGLTITPGASGEFAGVNVAVSFAGSRGIAVAGSAAAITLIGCSAGQLVNRGGTGVPGSGDATPFDIDAGTGGNELILRDCTVGGGALPSADWNALPGTRHGRYGVFEYSNGPALPPALSIALQTQYPDRPFQVSGGTLVWGPSVSSATAARAYIVGENPVDGIDSQPGLGSADRVYMNDTYTHLTVGRLVGAAAAVYGGDVYSSWAFNTTIRADASQIAVGSGAISWYQSAAALDVHFENGRFDMTGLTVRPFQIISPGAALGPKFLLRNSVLSVAGNQTANLGGALAAGRLDHNAYAFPAPLVGLDAVDPAAVILAAPPDAVHVPALGDPLYGAGAANALEFDQSGLARPGDRNDIGPVVGVTPDTSNRNKPYTQLTGVGTPPSPDDPAWFEWEQRLQNARLDNVPLERDTTYYFSQAGNDLTGDGSIGQPFKSLSWANGLVSQNYAASNFGSTSLIAPDLPEFRPGGKDFTIVMWASMLHYFADSKIAGKVGSWDLGYLDTDHFGFEVVSTGAATPTAVQWPTNLDSAWHFLVAGFDATNGRIFLSVDGAPAVTAAVAGDVVPGSGALRMFSISPPTNFTPGSMDDAAFWSSSPGQGGALSDADIAALYRGGNGRRYETVPPDLRAGLVSWWSFDEGFNPALYEDKTHFADLIPTGNMQPTVNVHSTTSGLRMRFRGGDVWREDASLSVGIPFVTVDTYGAGKAVFSRFTQSFGAGWTQVNGNLWKRASPTPVGWLRPAADPLGTILKLERTSTTTAGYPLSFFYDSTGSDPASGGARTLYLNPGPGVDPNLVPGGYESATYGGGWNVSADNVRLENLRVDGNGISPPELAGSGYGLIIQHRALGRAEFVGVGLEFYFNGYHSFGHISLGAIATFIDCKAGLLTNRGGTGAPGSGDVNPFVSFADRGGQEFLLIDSEVSFGGLPSWDWDAQPGQRHGIFGVFQHDVTGVDSPLLSIALRTRYPDNPWQVNGGTIVYGPHAASLADVRGYVIGESPADGIDSRAGLGGSNVAYINCRYSFLNNRILAAPSLYQDPAVVMDGWAINTTFRLDLSAWSGSGGMGYTIVGSPGVVNNRFINCRFDITSMNVEFFNFMNAVSTAAGPRFLLKNTIVSVSGSAPMGLGPIAPTALSHNAYYFEFGVPANLATLDPDGVVLPAPPIDRPPIATSPLYGAGAAGTLRFDAEGRPRASGQPDIGPLAGAPLPPPASVRLGAGRALLALTPGNLMIANAPIDRIVVYFDHDVDVNAMTARLVGDGGAAFSMESVEYDPVARMAIWRLRQPFAAGRARLTIDSTWIGDFRFESGILR